MTDMEKALQQLDKAREALEARVGIESQNAHRWFRDCYEAEAILRWYGDKSNYLDEFGFVDVLEDKGKRARDFLAGRVSVSQTRGGIDD